MTETQKDSKVTSQTPISSEPHIILETRKSKSILNQTLKDKSKKKLYKEKINLNCKTIGENIEK